MSRGEDVNWGTKEIIWDLFAKLGIKPEVILRDYDKIVRSDEIPLRTTPIDARTVKKVIDELQLLSVSVIATLPRHVQERREDWGDIQEEVKKLSDELIIKSHSSINTEKDNTSSNIGLLRERHLNYICNQAILVLECMENAELKRGAREFGIDDYEPLQIGSNDWRLDPVNWCDLVSPDFTPEKAWGDAFDLFKQHTKESRFWFHLEELHKNAKYLWEKYDSFAGKFSTADTQLNEKWELIKKTREYTLLNSRNPLTPTLEYQNANPYYSNYDCEQIMKRFYIIDPDLIKMQQGLQFLSEQLWDDLQPQNIDSTIYSGHCNKCPEGNASQQ